MKVEKYGKLFGLVALAGFVGMSPLMADGPDTPLNEEMETMGSSLKKIRKAEGFEAKAALVRKAREATIRSLKYMPATFKDMKDADAKAKASADYIRLMGLTLAGLGELELAYLSEDEDKADEVMDKLKDLKKEGHQAYKKDDD